MITFYKSTILLLSLGFVLCVMGLNAQQITSFSPKKIIGGMEEVLVIRGIGFGEVRNNSYVSFFTESGNYSPFEAANGYAYLKWTDEEIQLQMPIAFSNKIRIVVNGSEAFSEETLQVTANIGYRTVHPISYDVLVEGNSQGGITWYVHPDYWNQPEIREAIEEVMKEFRCKTDINYVLAPLEAGVPLNLNQGKYIIGPDSGLPVPGFNDKLWSTCILGAETFFYNRTQLMRFRASENWYYGPGKPPAGKSKFRYVLMHELGHSLGLGHVNEEGQTMFPSVTLLPSSNWSERDSITTEEQVAISHYVNKSQNFAFRACGLRPLEPVVDCTAVLDPLLSNKTKEVTSEKLILFPNPAEDRFYIDLELPTDLISVQIYTTTGQNIYTQYGYSSGGIFFPVSMSPGIYFVTLKTDKSTYTQRLIKL